MNAKIAVVTGASGGLGSQICRLLANRCIGLVLVDRDPENSRNFAAMLETSFPDCVRGTYAVDLSDHRSISEMATRIVQDFPKIDLLFNNAGILTETLRFSRYGNELQFEVNALAPLQLVDGLRPALAAADAAIVVGTSAGIASRAKTLDIGELVHPASFSKLFGPYVASKAALNVLTAALAAELAGEHIVFRTSDPGPVQTKLTKGEGTPMWMRLFYASLPKAASGAKRIVDAAFDPRWSGVSGVSISGGKIQPLPNALADAGFQKRFLASCRDLASAIATVSPGPG